MKPLFIKVSTSKKDSVFLNASDIRSITISHDSSSDVVRMQIRLSNEVFTGDFSTNTARRINEEIDNRYNVLTIGPYDVSIQDNDRKFTAVKVINTSAAVIVLPRGLLGFTVSPTKVIVHAWMQEPITFSRPHNLKDDDLLGLVTVKMDVK